MGKFIDLTGQRFGRLTVVSRAENTKYGHPRWKCRCDCGNMPVVSGNDLRRGHTESCGCLQKERTSLYNRDNQANYGDGDTRLYTIWQGIKARTSNPNTYAYKNYGERGIMICGEWDNSFQKFKQWALERGYQEHLTIDRIDNNKGYSSDNCRWVERKSQSINRRNNHYITYNGETKTLAEWARLLGIKRKTLSDRITRCGWNVEKALTTPTRKK